MQLLASPVLISCGQDSINKYPWNLLLGEPIETPLESPPTGQAVEVDGWKIVSSEIREFADKTDVELLTVDSMPFWDPRFSNRFDYQFHVPHGITHRTFVVGPVRRDPGLAGVEEAYPIAVGYNYKGYRLVGTLPEMFEEHEWSKGKKYEVQEGGRIFTEGGKEALVGSHVARRLGLSKGLSFILTVGWLSMREAGSGYLVVVGVLEPTGTPSDNAIWIPVKGFSKWKELTGVFSIHQRSSSLRNRKSRLYAQHEIQQAR